ncbi:MAG: 3-hydroxyacyl-CoA dehydrogenase family protein, partial [Syntrophaceae bacterium]|nr:3-hydroxyacyl-CoA dehydrogenase family protein [Syntrophaceae bacterium]
ALIGAGNMGEGIAQVFAQQGMLVRLVDRDDAILDRCQARIRANLELFQEYQLLQEAPAAVADRITATTCLDEALVDAGFVIETIFEDLAVKKHLYARLDDLPVETIIASNTSSIPIALLTEDMKTPQRVVGVHYFNPAHIMPLVEMHRGPQTSDATVETAREIMLRVGKKPILIGKSIPGFVVNRITGAMMREICYLLEEGVVTPEDLDTAMKSTTGFKMAWLGPMELEDMAGLDIACKVHSRTYQTLDNRTTPSPILMQKVERNELGIKTGKGWLDYGGKTKEEIMARTNRLLLRQLAIFKSRGNDTAG